MEYTAPPYRHDGTAPDSMSQPCHVPELEGFKRCGRPRPGAPHVRALPDGRRAEPEERGHDLFLEHGRHGVVIGPYVIAAGRVQDLRQ
jgi:hypothetical protein